MKMNNCLKLKKTYYFNLLIKRRMEVFECLRIFKKVTKKDIMDVVLVHNAAFRVFFLSELGDSLLKLFYSSYLKVNSTVILVAKKDGKVVGFVS